MLLQFFIIFAVCLLLLVLLAVTLIYTRVPTYRPSRDKTLKLMENMLEGHQESMDWLVFIGVPVRHDSELESIRQACYLIEQYAESQLQGVSFGVGIVRYNAEGMKLLQLQYEVLKKLIASTPITIRL